MSRISININYNRLNGYNEQEFKNVLKSRIDEDFPIDEEPKNEYEEMLKAVQKEKFEKYLEEFSEFELEKWNNSLKDNVKYSIEFNDNGCVINAESSCMGEYLLYIYIIANIMRIENNYPYVSNVSFDVY